jgi:uncharacterized protein YjbI with pentapeptide repeats
MMTITFTFLLGTFAVLMGAYLWFSLPRRLAQSAPAKLRTKKEDRYRLLLSQYLGGIAILIGLIAGYLQNQKTSANFERDFSARLAHDSRTEFFTTIEQLKGTDPSVRTAAIYALSELLHRDPSVREAVLLSLVAFVRAARSIDSHLDAVNTLVPLDVQAAIRVIGSRNRGDDSGRRRNDTNGDRVALDFARLALSGANFRSGDFEGANFQQSNLRGASFADSNVRGANFIEADFDYRCLAVVLQGKYDHTKIQPDHFWDAPLWWRQQVQATFASAVATDANFDHAQLVGVDFHGADLQGAQFPDANITYADFSAAHYAPNALRLARWTGEPHPESLKTGVAETAYTGPGNCSADKWNLESLKSPNS